MKKNVRQIIAIAALAAIIILIAAFVISAFMAGPGEAGNRFMALLFGIIAVPLLAWIMIFCIGRMQNKHTMAEFFPEQDTDTDTVDKIETNEKN